MKALATYEETSFHSSSSSWGVPELIFILLSPRFPGVWKQSCAACPGRMLMQLAGEQFTFPIALLFLLT